MHTRANEPQSIGGILDRGFKLFGGSTKQILPITYMAALLGAILGWVLQKTLLGDFVATGEVNFNVPLLAILYIVMGATGAILMSAAIIRIQRVFAGEDVSLGNSLVAGLKRSPAVIGASILYMLALLGGSILLLVPGMYLGVTLAFSFYAAATDNKGPLESIGYSHSLVKGNWWRTAGLLTIIMIIAGVFYVAIGFIAGIFAVTRGTAEALEQSVLVDIVIVPVITSVVTAIIYCLAYTVYDDLKLRNEGTDLAERIENLE